MSASPGPDVIRVKKYPNRRFYDVTHSKHVTLEDLYRHVREGQVVCVTDSKTGEDITPQVLTQIILEHDPPKIAMFGSELLHQVIQANQSLLRQFVDTYFGRALNAFVHSQEQFTDFLRRSGVPMPPAANPLSWAQTWFQPPRPTPQPEPQAPEDAGQLRETVDDLRRQLTELQEELKERKRSGKKKGT